MHVRPVAFQEVPVVRPVAKVRASPVHSPEVKAVSERSGEGGQRGAGQRPARRRSNGQSRDEAEFRRDPGTSLAVTLAVLAIDRTLGEPEAPDRPT